MNKCKGFTSDALLWPSHVLPQMDACCSVMHTQLRSSMLATAGHLLEVRVLFVFGVSTKSLDALNSVWSYKIVLNCVFFYEKKILDRTINA